MNDQRMVDVGLLEELRTELASYFNKSAYHYADKLNDIISGPGVEPVAFMFMVQEIGKGRAREFAAIDYFEQEGEKIVSKEPLYLAAPSAPVQPISSNTTGE